MEWRKQYWALLILQTGSDFLPWKLAFDTLFSFVTFIFFNTDKEYFSDISKLLQLSFFYKMADLVIHVCMAKG